MSVKEKNKKIRTTTISNFKIFDKEMGQKIAEGMGLVLPSDQPNEMDYLNLREKMQVPELSFKVKISKRRLPRKLKKAARHADFDMMDPQFKTDALSDSDAVNCMIEYYMRVRIHPASYPRTKWVQRLTSIVRRMIARQHRRNIRLTGCF